MIREQRVGKNRLKLQENNNVSRATEKYFNLKMLSENQCAKIKPALTTDNQHMFADVGILTLLSYSVEYLIILNNLLLFVFWCTMSLTTQT